MHVRQLLRVASLLVAALVPAAAGAQGTRLLRRPTVSRDLVAFEYGGDLWAASRSGGIARRLTASPSMEIDPRFSPDGSMIAYTATVANNADVYVVPAAGGEPKRLTYHPGGDYVRGWTPDGRRIIFASTRGTTPTPGANAFLRLWTIAPQGGMPERLPMPRAFAGAFAPDGKRIAYQQHGMAIFDGPWAEPQASQWRRYRGGRTQPIRVMNLADYSEQALPWTNSNDIEPMWVGNTVYFLSDRDNTVNLYGYDLATQQLTQLTHEREFDIMSASAGADAIVYEAGGSLHLVDLRTGAAHQLAIDVRGDFPWARPQMKKVGPLIADATLSPTGVRVAFEARGDIFSVSASDAGDFRNLTHSSGAHDRAPAWSPGGTHVAWLSDQSGEDQLMVADQLGADKPRAIALPSRAFFSALVWSPDGHRLLLRDSGANLWVLDIASGRFTRIDADTYDDPGRGFDATWSPDSRWVAYSKSLESHLRSIFLYSLAAGKSYRVTDRMADAISPAFDASGKYLAFLASTDYALRIGWLDMSQEQQVVTRSIYLALLDATQPSPVRPRTKDEPERAAGDTSGAADTTVSAKRGPAKRPPREGTAAARDTSRASGAGTMHVDLDGLERRIVALRVPPADYRGLTAGSAGTLIYSEAPPGSRPGAPLKVGQVQIEDGKPLPLIDGVLAFAVSANGKWLLYGAPENHWGVVSTEQPAKAGDGALDVDRLETVVDPQAEWAEIFREEWRVQREFFYDAKMHGNDWQAIYDKYAPLVPFVRHRADLAYLIASVGGELTVGHSYLEGEGDVPDTAHVSVGLLGADFAVENGRYRITHIYTGGSWNPQMQAPLAVPGLRVAEGDYLLAINGQPLTAETNLYSLFEGTAGRQTTIRVSHTPSPADARAVTVVPVPTDEPLRTQEWIDHNRHVVDSLSGGRLAYVWLPNTAGAGLAAFKRYYYAQQEKDGVIIDERFNQGGEVADFIIDQLRRSLSGYFAERAGKPITSPMAGIFGPKVMVINESAGSGGDALPYLFHLNKLGPLVGTRTWGGLVGTIGDPAAIDQGGITAPDLAFYDLQGKWAVENEGVAPDIVVENTAAEVIKGRDPQLERAVAEGMKLLREQVVQRAPRPEPIDRVSGSPKH